jgi:hypothetical protein
VTSDNILILNFSQALDTNLTAADIVLSIEGLTDFTFILEQASPSEWHIVLSTTQQIPNGALATVQISNAYPELSNHSSSGSLASQHAPRTDEEALAEVVGTITSTIAAVFVTTAVVDGFVIGNLSSAWCLISSLQLVAYIPMMDIDLPLVLSQFFISLMDFSIVPNVFAYIEPDDSPTNIDIARRVDLDSSLFLLNSASLTTFIGSQLVWPISLLLSWCCCSKVAEYFVRTARGFRWCFYIRFVIEDYLELVFAVLFQLHFASTDSYNIMANCALAVVALVVVLVAPVAVAVFTYKHSHRFKDQDEKDLRTKYGSLFDEFKNDRGFLSCSFYALFLVRRALYAVVMYCLEVAPVVQVCLHVLHSALTSMFVALYRPFTEHAVNFSTFSSEVGIALSFLLSGLYLLDLSSTSRLIVQWTVMGIVYSVMLVNILVSLVLTVQTFKRTCTKWRQSDEHSTTL